MNTSSLKAGVRRGLAEVYYRSGLFKRRLRGKVVILTYHRVLSHRELVRDYVQPGMYVRADVFAFQMQFLREHFEVLSFPRLLELWTSGGLAAGRRYCVVTFDDGWRDNYVHAYPVLKRLGIPATIFLPTRFVGTDEWFWPEKLAYLMEQRWQGRASPNADRRALEAEIEAEIGRWKLMRRAEIDRALEKLVRESGASTPRERLVMSWDEVVEMARNGISFGSHSSTHAILTLASAADVDQELRSSLRELEERQVNCVPVFCYPNGDYSAQIAAQVRAAGYRGAVCSEPGWETRMPRNVFALRRVAIHNDVSQTVPLFALRLSGLDEALRRPWHSLRRLVAEATA
jgi:peptidoglycan/xylan/chitin deacetylase (PgdA/CDA1 family)